MAKHNFDVDEPEQPRKLVKLSDENASTNDVTTAPHDEDEETDIGMDDETSEAAAAQAAARQRAALQHPMTGVPPTSQVNGATNGTAATAADDEEVDPLDAYMADLSEQKPQSDSVGLRTTNGRKTEPQAYYSDDDDIMTAVDDHASSMLDASKRNIKKKDLPTVDHAKMKYEVFQKQFYTEPLELSAMSEDEVIRLRHEMEDIKVRGNGVPVPVQNFAQCGLGLTSLHVISSLGFQKPTAIQAQAIPVIMSGRDMIGIAKTGSGKTIAFLLPMFRHIRAQRKLARLEGPIGLIVTPTRELATQIHRECKPWLKALDLRAMCAYGGAPISDQIGELKRGAEIVVCTPGRMIDLLAANAGRVTNLKRVTYCVLDEADRMFDLGFGPQIKMILDRIRPSRQTVLFSATFPPKMDDLARTVLKKPVEIIVGGRAVVGKEITQLVEVMKDDNEKFSRLLNLLGKTHNDEDARSLVFVDRQDSAEKLMNEIMRKGYPCHSIHGQKDQYDRNSIISDFKAGIFPVLVATSVAARGLDVKQLKLVVNFDCPNHLEDYVHRAGRTGRAGEVGTAVTFITQDQERYSPDIVKALVQSEAKVPEAIQKMSDAFLEKAKSGKAKAAGGGFGGKGLSSIDQKREAEKRELRKQHKTEDDIEELEPAAADEEDGLAGLEKFKVKATAAPEAEAKEDNKEEATPAAPQVTGIPAHISLDPESITVQRTEKEDAPNPKHKLSAAEIAKARIDARLRKAGDIRGTAPIDNKGPDAGAFHSTLEINDFPQKARWAVTNRTNVAKILDATGTSITTKGNWYAPGKEPDPQKGELPKLYILVEGDTEVVVTDAMRELMRLLKDAALAASDQESRAPTSIAARYNA